MMDGRLGGRGQKKDAEADPSRHDGRKNKKERGKKSRVNG